MGKLIYKTKIPKPPAVMWEGFSTHKVEIFEKLPENERQGLDLINSIMMEVLPRLESAGYDPAKVYFSIGFEPKWKPNKR